VYKGSGDFHPSARHTNELCDVPGVEPPLPHHSLIARKATINVKDPFDEYIIFHRSIPPVPGEDWCTMLPAAGMSRDACTTSYASRLRLR
jgi:hypothetical protein